MLKKLYQDAQLPLMKRILSDEILNRREEQRERLVALHQYLGGKTFRGRNVHTMQQAISLLLKPTRPQERQIHLQVLTYGTNELAQPRGSTLRKLVVGGSLAARLLTFAPGEVPHASENPLQMRHDIPVLAEAVAAPPRERVRVQSPPQKT